MDEDSFNPGLPVNRDFFNSPRMSALPGMKLPRALNVSMCSMGIGNDTIPTWDEKK